MSSVFPVLFSPLGLLAGLALAAIPVVLHLIMRQKPRTLRFPAFRFLMQKRRTNLRKLRLRHLILLALRILLIALLFLAIARPRSFHQGLGLSSERPVAAVLVFDTSPSMDYKTTDGVTRLDEAKKRGLEFLEELPEGSLVAVLDSAKAVQPSRGDWLSKSLARDRIAELKVASGGAITSSLEHAYRLLADLGRKTDDETSRYLPRFVCVFSDRARACWDMSRQTRVLEASDDVPPALEGLQQAREIIAPLMDRLKELRQHIPPSPGQDFPDQALVDFLDQLRDQLPSLTKDDMPPSEKLSGLVQNVERRGRDLLALLPPPGSDGQSTSADQFSARLRDNLADVLARLRGAQGLFFDVGVEKPIDLAVVQLDLPRSGNGQVRQVFTEDESLLIQAVVAATGKDFSTTLELKLDKKTLPQAVEIKAGETKTIGFEIDLAQLKLGPGQHQIEARLATPDLLAFNNQRYATFAIREARRVLVLADDPPKAEYFVRALRSWKFRVDVKKPAEDLPDPGLFGYQAVYLFGLTAPNAALWDRLRDYVDKGGGVGIVPGGREMRLESYNKGAQEVMPGVFASALDEGADPYKPGAPWNLKEDSIYQHPLFAPIRAYKDDESIDYNRLPSSAYHYWQITPHEREASVLVHYKDAKKHPALLERRRGRDDGQAGKIILFTTPLDARKPRWNDYLRSDSSFYLVIITLCTNYLAGETEGVHLNFTAGQGEPAVTLPLDRSYPAYTLQGPGILEQIPAPEGNRLSAKQATVPGNYVVYGVDKGAAGNQRVAAFSVNLPADESDLSRVPASEIDAVFGAGSVLASDRKAGIRDILEGHWSEPLELFPVLMVLLLLLLAVENLLANKFYKRDNLDAEKS